MCKAMEDLRNESLLEGRLEGKLENMTDTATRMLTKGSFSLDTISEVSGLSLEEVKELQAELSGSVSDEDE